MKEHHIPAIDIVTVFGVALTPEVGQTDTLPSARKRHMGVN